MAEAMAVYAFLVSSGSEVVLRGSDLLRGAGIDSQCMAGKLSAHL